MAWYKAGTVTVTNGSATVTGAGGTSFVSNVVVGDAFQAPDGRSYEIVAVVSATELTLGRPYMGATAGGQAYTIQPTSSFASDLATRVVQLIGSFGAVRDGIGQGLISDGTVTTPGLRFAAQPDTGFYRDAANTLSIATGGVRAVRMSAAGIGMDTGKGLHWIGNGNEMLMPSDGVTGWVLQTNGAFTVRTLGGVSRFSVATDGRLIAPTGHVLARPGTTENALIAGFGFDSGVGIQMRSAVGPAGNSGACALWVNCNSQNNRSINAGGTVNASGADYAEYMVKADGCGSIGAGDVCGVDRDGKLTRTWADAISFVVKSTNPSLVGGDTWAAGLPPRPDDLPAEPVAPTPPTQPDDMTTDEAEERWAEATRAYQDAQAAYLRDHTDWQRQSAQHVRELAAWDTLLEAERVKVDRIAFSGQVPVNFTDSVEVGDYLVAVANGGGIKAIAVPDAEITFDQYRRRLGKVWAIRDDRPWIDVQHG